MLCKKISFPLQNRLINRLQFGRIITALGRRQAVRQRTLTPSFGCSNHFAPATSSQDELCKRLSIGSRFALTSAPSFRKKAFFKIFFASANKVAKLHFSEVFAQKPHFFCACRSSSQKNASPFFGSPLYNAVDCHQLLHLRTFIIILSQIVDITPPRSSGLAMPTRRPHSSRRPLFVGPSSSPKNASPFLGSLSFLQHF